MIKGVLLLLIVLLSCNNIDNRQGKEFSDKDKAVNFAISNLKKLDRSGIYDLYYVIETEDNFLYVINTNKNNRLTFMYFFDTIDCKPIKENEYIIYLNRSSDNPQKDNCVGKSFNVILNLTEGEVLLKLQGIIFKKSTINNIDKYTLIKEGDILKDVENDPELIIKEVPGEEPEL